MTAMETSALVISQRLAEERGLVAGIGARPGTEEHPEPAIHVYVCDASEATGLPRRYEGLDVVIHEVKSAAAR